MVASWLKLDSKAKKTYPRVTTDKKIENEKCGNYYTHKIFSKTLHFEQKQLGLNTFSSRISDIPSTRVWLEGMSEIQAKRFSLDNFSPFCVINR